ncbi:hypothetical protein SteCoe_26738 [Stentor coeruleus]|uniref:choline-phosphate cytidylyltransferase n=1 Tax=Stentor coeruleus TaxID=5963 RepID=A0A1R2BC50_9CILI|nr:hypothetical protein SteCoe_26738 [Stentor coeruleus]
MNEQERAESVRQCKWVDEVICPCPWVSTLDFMNTHNINYICHDNTPYIMGADITGDVYYPSKQAGRFLATQRTEGVSTSDLIIRMLISSNEFVRENKAKSGSSYSRYLKPLRQGFTSIKVNTLKP